MKLSTQPLTLLGLFLLVAPTMTYSQGTQVFGATSNMGASVSSSGNARLTSIVGELIGAPAASRRSRLSSGFIVILRGRRGPLGVDEPAGLPAAFALHQNYPNPFNPGTTLEFDLPVAAQVRVVVYDLQGREWARLVDRRLEPGYHQLVWNGRGRGGRELPSGMYIVLLATPQFRKSIKLLLLK